MYIELTGSDFKKCEEFGRQVVASYGAGKKEASKALFIDGKPAIHDNPRIQTLGRLGELAFVRAFDLADDYLDWTDKCDGSQDIQLQGLKIDVKSSDHPRTVRLMWPVSKNNFIEKMADILVLVKLEVRDADTSAELLGWIGKHTFLKRHKTASGIRGIKKGTKYMHKDQLNDMRDLRPIIEAAKL